MDDYFPLYRNLIVFSVEQLMMATSLVGQAARFKRAVLLEIIIIIVSYGAHAYGLVHDSYLEFKPDMQAFQASLVTRFPQYTLWKVSAPFQDTFGRSYS